MYPSSEQSELFPLAAELQSPYASEGKERWVEVLVDCPGAQGLFTYRVPPQLSVAPGDVLSVPFGAQQLGAIAIRLVNCPPANLEATAIRNVEDVVSQSFFPATYWQWLERVANYYYTPLIQAIKTALPPGLLARSQRRIGLSDRLPPGAEAFLSVPGRRVLQFLQASKSKDYAYQYLRQKLPQCQRGVQELLARQWVRSYLEPPKLPRAQQRQAVTLVNENGAESLTPRQQEVLDTLRRQGGDMWLTELLQTCKTTSSVVQALERKGCVVIAAQEKLRAPHQPSQPKDLPKDLTPEQRHAVEQITALEGYTQVLLHGVTGSGKTEVYLQAIAPLLQQGKSAIVLVPEIGLTPQLTDRFCARFGNKVRVYHSALSEGERYDAWRQMLTGEAQVVIGTRSAVFAPLPNLGAIVLDEEYDGSYKQESPPPTYHARTVARWRSQLANCPLILGAATPSLETWVEVRDAENRDAETTGDRSLYLSLPERIHARPLPQVEVVDMRQEFKSGNRSIFGRSLRQALQALQEGDNQGILFVPRRGHSTFVSCRDCGTVLQCPHCDISLSYHYVREGAPQLLRCHYCNHQQAHPRHCPACGSPYLKFFGTGTQRVARELTETFPELPFLRFDSDTTRTKGAHRALLSQFAKGEAKLLVGTQMLAKGLDLPQVTLVGIVAADGLLNLSDYRASERAFQLLTQVAGRAGRGDEPGRVILQTYTPDHPAIQSAMHHDYEGFSAMELEQRSLLEYPPYVSTILLRLSSPDAAAVEAAAEELAQILQPAQDRGELTLLGPAPAPVMRVARRYRWHLLLKFPAEACLPECDRLREVCRQRSVSLTVDVDPMDLG